jgi:hypothetical protein
MRNLFHLALFLTLGFSSACLQGQNARDILQKAIAFHDPDGNWEHFKGKMQHVTVFGHGYIVNETVELDRPRDYYRSTATQDFGKVVRGMDEEKPFFSVNGKAPESEELIQNWSLTSEGVAFFKEQHTCHFGLLMHLQKTGMTLSEKADTEEFDGRTCYALKFTGDADQVSHSYFTGFRILYVDKQTYELRGVYGKVGDYVPYHYYFSGVIEIHGIKVPHSRVFVREDGYRFTSINMPAE